jgi:hypothetical protein
MTSAWRDRVKQLGEAGAEASKKVKQQIEVSAPEVSRRVQQQIKTTAPVVAHKAREVGKVLAAPASPAVKPDNIVAQQFPAEPSPLAVSSGSAAASAPHRDSSTAPAAASSPGTRPSIERPTTVHVAYLSLVVAAAGSAVLAGLGVYGLTEIRGSVDKVMNIDRTGTLAMFAHNYLDNAEETLMSSAIGLGIVFALGYVLVAHAIRVGHRWPRPVSTVLAVLSIPILFLGPFGLAIFIAGVVAVLALWSSSARQYTSQLKAAKRLARRA